MNVQYNRRHTDNRPAPTGGMTQAQVLAFCMARAAELRRPAPVVVTIPATFWDDHGDRCPHDDEDDLPQEIERKGSRVTIKANQAGLRGLIADATYYAGADAPDEAPRAVVASARRTLAVLEGVK